MEPTRRTVAVDGTQVSYLAAGTGRPLLLLHGTFWSRVWEPVVAPLGALGRQVLAPDLPGFGLSEGELEPESATAPALADWAVRFLDAVEADGPAAVAGHDIGGAVAQQLVARHPARVARLALVDSVLDASWPVEAVARFADPDVRAATTPDELVEARRTSLRGALASPPSPDEEEAWLAPWREEAKARSWTALAAAADARYTEEVEATLVDGRLPLLLLWGAEDRYQPLEQAERLAGLAPAASLVVVPGASHLVTHDDPDAVVRALGAFLA